jgi:carbonic anhydrase/acetyltransferase-like protein (isoleucine patch superfamily)
VVERYSNIPTTKLSIVQPPSRGFPGIRPYGIAGILSYLKTVIHRHTHVQEEWEEWGQEENTEEWTQVEFLYSLGDIFARIQRDRDSLVVSLFFPEEISKFDIENIRQELEKNESILPLPETNPNSEASILSRPIFDPDPSYQIQFYVSDVDIPPQRHEDDEEFFNLPPETHDFGDGNFEVPAHKHPNGGGWVAETARVDPTVYLGEDAKVFGDARVSGNAQVYYNARVSGNAQVSDAYVSGNAQISGTAEISGGYVSGKAHISGGNISAGIIVGGRISGNAQISGGRISGNAQISGGTVEGGTISGDAVINEGAHITSGMGINGGTHP